MCPSGSTLLTSLPSSVLPGSWFSWPPSMGALWLSVDCSQPGDLPRDLRVRSIPHNKRQLFTVASRMWCESYLMPHPGVCAPPGGQTVLFITRQHSRSLMSVKYEWINRPQWGLGNLTCISSIVYTSLSSDQIKPKLPHFFITNHSNFYSVFPHPKCTPITFMDVMQLYKNCWFNSATHKGGWRSTYGTEKAITLSGVTQQASPGARKQTNPDLSKGHRAIAKAVCSSVEENTSKMSKSSLE